MSQTSMILLAVLFVSIGAIIGALVASLFAGREREKPGRSPRKPVQDPDRVEMFRVIRSRPDGKLHLEISGQSYSEAGQLPEAAKPALQRLLVELAAWLGLQPARRGDIAERQTSPPAAPVPRVEIPSFSVDKPVATVEVPARTLSIVEQIDDLLRERLAASPLRDRGIHLAEDPREGVLVWVGVEKFAGIDAVTDETVKQFIKQVVAEWEARQTRHDR